jgi:hypothetical protein
MTSVLEKIVITLLILVFSEMLTLSYLQYTPRIFEFAIPSGIEERK